MPSSIETAEAVPLSIRLAVHGIFFSCLILQKFGLVIGDSFVYVGLPACILLFAAAALSGTVRISASRLVSALMLAGGFLIASMASFLAADVRGSFSLPSLVLAILLFMLMTVVPARAIGSEWVVRTFCRYVLFICICGIAQYLGQFVGFRFVSFGDTFPALNPVLIERFFNSDAVVAYGSHEIRSNGLFLLEPSGFSQLIVIAAVAEVAVLKRAKYIALYAAAYFVTFSGTGALSLIAAIALRSLSSVKMLIRTILVVLVALAALLVAEWTRPDVVDRYAGRAMEFEQPGTSAYLRYVAQGIAWRELSADSTLVTGLGPGAFERHFVPKGMSATNPIIKFSSDYGMLVAGLWLVLFVRLYKTPRAPPLGVTVVAVAILGGGNELNPAFLMPMLILCAWSGLCAARIDDSSTWADTERTSIT